MQKRQTSLTQARSKPRLA